MTKRALGFVSTLPQTRERLERWLAEYERYGFSKWAVVLRRGEELIGRCGLSPEQINGVDEWELG
jgi:ribosomal-protein-alanine N-acetyltransferase